MKFLTLYLCVFLIALKTFSQGLINNGANIIFNGSAQVYIDGATGHFTNQLAGMVTPSATSTITLLGNWVNNSSPANVVFASDGGGVVMIGANQTIGGTNPTAFYNLTLQGSGTKQLTVNSNTVGGQSIFTGILNLTNRPLDLNSNTLNITNAATSAIARTSGYIISETTTGAGVNNSIIRWYHRTTSGSKVYPFGVSAGYYIPFTFNITTALPSSTDYVDVSTRTSPANNTPWAGISNVAAVGHMFSPNVPYADGTIPAVIDRWWDISPSAAVTANATFSYLGSENTLDILYSGGLIGAQYWNGSGWLPDNATIGSAVAVSGVGVVGSVTANGLTTFCPWVLSSVVSPLPIELINFDVTCLNNTIDLNWCTATEKNNSYFTLEYSSNAIDFFALANVNGNGTTNSKHCYNYQTKTFTSDLNYYRLKQTDNTGKMTTSKTISIKGCKTTKDNFTLTNNGSPEIILLSNSTSNQAISVVITNSLGQLIFEKNISINEGFSSTKLDLNNVVEGIYYVNVLNYQGSLSTKKISITQH